LTGFIHKDRWEGPEARISPAQLLSSDAPLVVADFSSPLAWVVRWVPPSHPLHGRKLGEVYRYLVDKYLRPVSEIRDAAETWRRANIGDARSLAVHVRLTDKPNEIPGIINYYERLPEIIRLRLASFDDAKLFVMTDAPHVLEELRAKFPGRVVCTDCVRSPGNTGLHYLKDIPGSQLAREVMTDSLIAASCTEFIGSGSSNVACMISRLKSWGPGCCELSGVNLQNMVHSRVFTMPTPPEEHLNAARKQVT
jgi:hypothetical protein